MSNARCWVALLLLVSGLPLSAQTKPSTAPAALPSFAEPAISPDGSEIAFCSGGDIWTVPATGGNARLLISHPTTESRPLYSPDGRSLAFVSTRTGGGDIYLLNFDTGDLKRLTYDDGSQQLDAWSRDGRWIYFSTTAHEAGISSFDIYRVSAEGGTPMPMVADRYANQFSAAPTPDGTGVAFAAGGNSSREWWRRGRSHADECELWLMHERTSAVPSPTFERLTELGAKDLWPMWSPDGRTLYFVSDRGGPQNLWARDANGKSRALTHFTDGRVIWPTISADGKTIVFERNFGIWSFNTESGSAVPVSIKLRGTSAAATVEHHIFNGDFSELALSPDGRKVAFIVHGQVFAASARDGGDAVRITHTGGIESQLAWSRDSRRLAYISNRDGPRHIFITDFNTSNEFRLTNGVDGAEDARPRFSPDDRSVAFIRNGSALLIRDLDSRQQRVAATGQSFDRPPFDSSPSPFTWSPRGDWIAFLSTMSKGFRNVQVVQTPTSVGNRILAAALGREPPRQVSFMANTGSRSVSWSPDGTTLLFETGQRTEDYQLARVDLVPKPPRFREDQFRDLFREPVRTFPPTLVPSQPPHTPEPPHLPATLPATTGPAPAPSGAAPATAPSLAQLGGPQQKIVFEGIRQRLSLVPVGVDVEYQTISPDGKWVLMIARAAGQQNLYVYPLDDGLREAPVARQLTATPGGKSFPQFTPDSREVYFLDGGRISIVSLETRTPRLLPVTADLDVDFAVEKVAVFHQAWSYLRDQFFDPRFNGVDWQAQRAQYEPRIAGARTPEELRRLLELMVGELNASHVHVASPTAPRETVGRLGIIFDRLEYERAGRLRATEVIPFGPAAVAGIGAGDAVLAVDGVPVNARTNLDHLLAQKIGKAVALRVSSSAAATPPPAEQREVRLLPVDRLTEKTLLYRAWVESRRAYVDRISHGRLGYIHLADMTESAMARLNVDMDSETAARQGVVVDVRYNRGGFVNGFAIDVFARKNYLTMSRRGGPPVPSRLILGQRALLTPTVLVTNRMTYSDAEDFVQGYRALKLGKIVGEPTAGAVIFTSNYPLLDGSLFGLPFEKVVDDTGQTLEMHPRPVDVLMLRPVGETYTGGDRQLDAAVGELIKQLDAHD